MRQKMHSRNEDQYRNLRNEIELIKEYVDPEFLLELLGFDIYKNTNHELRSPCIIHGGDNQTAFRFNKETKHWACFSHKCHETHGSDIIGLVRGCLGLSFIEAVEYLKEISGFKGENSEELYKYKRERAKKRFIENVSNEVVKPKIKFLDENILNKYKEYGPTLFRKYFNRDVINFFELGGGYKDSQGIIKDIIPIRGVDGELVGCSFRDTRENIKIDDKYKTFVNKDKVLYNLYNAKNYLHEKPLIIVEGFKSVWRLYELGIKNVVCIMGSEITPGQVPIIHAHAAKGVVVMFDNDFAGIKGAFKAYKQLSRKTPTSLIFITEIDNDGKGLDPADLTDEQLLFYLKDYC